MDLSADLNCTPSLVDDVDLESARRLFEAVHAHATHLVGIAHYKEKPAKPNFFDVDWIAAGDWAKAASIITARSGGEHRGVALTVCAFAAPKRDESHARSIAALVVDIDEKEFGKLVPGATTVEEIVPEVVRRLDARGLRGHALVHSGNGLHVYVLFERVDLLSDTDHQRVKGIWYALCSLLGDARDRYDLASVIRLPGTVNRKYGGHASAYFLRDHLDLERARYTLDAIDTALTGLPRGPSATTSKKKSASCTGHAAPVLTKHEQDIFQMVLRLDKKFAEHRHGAQVGKYNGSTDRSAIEFGYACRMIEMGFSEGMIQAELVLCARGKTEKVEWIDSTILKAMQKVYGTVNHDSAEVLRLTENTADALYAPYKAPTGDGNPLLPVVTSAVPSVTAVVARAGGSKTTDLLAELAASTWSLGAYDRIGVATAFVNEGLHHEHAINDGYPTMRAILNGMPYDSTRRTCVAPCARARSAARTARRAG